MLGAIFSNSSWSENIGAGHSADSGVTIPDIDLINAANTDINMGVVSTTNSQFKTTSYATTLGFTATSYPAGQIITVAGVDISLSAYVAGADPTVTLLARHCLHQSKQLFLLPC